MLSSTWAASLVGSAVDAATAAAFREGGDLNGCYKGLGNGSLLLYVAGTRGWRAAGELNSEVRGGVVSSRGVCSFVWREGGGSGTTRQREAAP